MQGKIRGGDSSRSLCRRRIFSSTRSAVVLREQSWSGCTSCKVWSSALYKELWCDSRVGDTSVFVSGFGSTPLQCHSQIPLRRPDNADVPSETGAEPSLQATQMKLKRARLADNLNEKIAQRPGPMELVEKNILPVDSSLKQAIIGGNLRRYGAAFGREEACACLVLKGLFFSAVLPQWVRSTIPRCWTKTAATPSLQSSRPARSLRAPSPLRGSPKCWRCPLQARPPQHYRAACCRSEADIKQTTARNIQQWQIAFFLGNRFTQPQSQALQIVVYASFVWFRCFHQLHKPQQWSPPMATLCSSRLSLLSARRPRSQAQPW